MWLNQHCLNNDFELKAETKAAIWILNISCRYQKDESNLYVRSFAFS